MMKPPNDSFLHYIITTQRPVYCAAPLFSPISRMAAANLAAFVELEVMAYCQSEGIELPADNLVFLPYRDTKQDTIQGPDRAKKIYTADIQRLENCSCLLARFDNLAKDTGVAMEIGFAYGHHIPIGVLVTDFIWEGHINCSTPWQFDPIIALMANVTHCIPAMHPITASYYLTNMMHEYESLRQFVHTCMSNFQVSTNVHPNPQNGSIDRSVFVDIMGGRYEWARNLQNKISSELSKQGYSVFLAQRYANATISPESLAQAANNDILNLLQSRIIVISGDAPEIEPGSAALFGLAKARGLRAVFQYTSSLCYKGLGGQVMKVNLMVEQAADYITSSLDQTLQTIRQIKE